MVSTIEERIKQLERADETWSYSELLNQRKEIEKDINFVYSKSQYWGNLKSKLLKSRSKLIGLMILARKFCEICGQEQKEGELKTLPDKKRVCKKCWKKVVEETRLKNLMIE